LKRQNRKERRQERRENRQERREDRNLLPLGLGVAGTGLALYACLEAFRNKERIDENAINLAANSVTITTNTASAVANATAAAAAQATAAAATPDQRQINNISARPLYAIYDDASGYLHENITAQDIAGTNIVTKHTNAPATMVWHGEEMVVAGPISNELLVDQFYEKGNIYFRPTVAGVSQDSCQLIEQYYNNSGNETTTSDIIWTLENQRGIFVGYEQCDINYSQTTITINGLESKRRKLTFSGTGKTDFTMYYNVLNNNNKGKFLAFDQQ
jgi:hypothetical protein